jgi:septum formation protein
VAAARSRRDGCVIGADTIVVCNNRGLGKPTDGTSARWMLEQLSGHVHQVYSGVAVVDARSGASATGSALTHVHFRRLPRKEIDAYVRTGESSDKAGAYAIQGRARAFVLKVDGPLDNVIGLPVKTLIRVMERMRW